MAQFTHDQLPTYKQLRNFAKDNQYNFPFVPADYQGHVSEFVKIENDPWPIENLRSYIKLMRELKTILDEVRESMREKIRIAYNEQFDYLEKVAAEQNVPTSVLANRENTILAKTTPENILVLQNNISTDVFYQNEIGKILDYAKQHTPTPPQPAPGGGQPEPTKPQKRIRQASLQTKTSIPLSSEEDIDHYLNGLKQQILKLLADNDGVMIIK